MDFANRFKFYSSFIKPGDLCFDVGANLGNRTSVFLELGASVVAVEPQSSCAEILNRQFAGHPGFALVESALGAQEGQAEMFMSDTHVISSMSSEWIRHVQSSGRFASLQWNHKKTVPVTTLDRLIDQFGIPEFCKIDVEGYELEVLRGLTHPVPNISFEYTKEHSNPIITAIRYLAGLGPYRFNLSMGESMFLSLREWLDTDRFIGQFKTVLDRTQFAWGDIYATLNASDKPVFDLNVSRLLRIIMQYEGYDFIAEAHRELLNREPSVDEIIACLERLKSGASKWEILMGLLFGQEAMQKYS